MSDLRPLRITHVHPLSLDLFGHADRDFGINVRYFLPNLLFALARSGGHHTLHLLTSERRTHSLTVENVKVLFHPALQPPPWVGANRRFARQFSLGMLRSIRSSDAEIVHFHASRALHGMLGLVGMRCRRQGIPLVAQDQGARPVGRVEGALQRWGLRRVAAALAANNDSVEFYRTLGIPAERIHFTPNGIDPSIFRPASGDRAAVGEPFRILFVGRVWEDKDPLTMARGVVEFASRGHRIDMKIIGDGPLLDEVRELLTAGGVPLTVIGPLPQRDLAAQYRAADVLVQTSVGEGFNCVSLEALACGLPVVASDAAGLREPVGDAGVLVPVEDPRALADALETLLTDPDEWHRRRRLGIERGKHFTWDSIARDLQSLYRRLAAEFRGCRDGSRADAIADDGVDEARPRA